MGYLTLRLRGAFFAIATLALAVVLQTLIINWDFVGGARGAYIIRAGRPFPSSAPISSICSCSCSVLAVIAVGDRAHDRALAARLRLRHHPRRRARGRGVRRPDAEAEADRDHGLGRASWAWPARRFPITSAMSSRARAFGLAYAVNSIAMPMIGGTTSWIGPLIGAILLGTLQQVATVTISSAVNLLIVGVLLVGLRDRRAERHRRAWSQQRLRGAGRAVTHDRAASRSREPQQALRRLRRARRRQSCRDAKASGSA